MISGLIMYPHLLVSFIVAESDAPGQSQSPIETRLNSFSSSMPPRAFVQFAADIDKISAEDVLAYNFV